MEMTRRYKDAVPRILRECVERAAKDQFDTIQTKLIFSVNVLSLTVMSGGQTEGSFTVLREDGGRSHLQIYSDLDELVFPKTAFFGTEHTVFYRYDARNLGLIKERTGYIYLVSDCGEQKLPVKIEVTVAKVSEGQDSIQDMSGFINFAKTNLQAASKVFVSDEFEKLISDTEQTQKMQWSLLRTSTNPLQALDEFMVANHWKNRAGIKLRKEQLSCGLIQATEGQRVLSLDVSLCGWGWFEAEVVCEAPYVEVLTPWLRQSEFTMGSYMIQLVVHPERMENGENQTIVHIRNVHMDLSVPFSAQRPEAAHIQYSGNPGKKTLLEFTYNDLEYRQNKVSKDKWIEKGKRLLDTIPSALLMLPKQYYQAWFSVSMEYGFKGEKRIKRLDEMFSKTSYGSFPQHVSRPDPDQPKPSPLEFCTYVYLKALFMKDAAVSEQARVMISDYYYMECNSPAMLWLLIQMEKMTKSGLEKSMHQLRRHINHGLNSRIFYLELGWIYLQEPGLFKKLGKPEYRMIWVLFRSGQLSEELQNRFFELLEKERGSSEFILVLLNAMYTQAVKKEQDNTGNDKRIGNGESGSKQGMGTSKEPAQTSTLSEKLLKIIVSLLIRSQKVDENAHIWYERAILARVKVTELYEYFMYSLPKENPEKYNHAIPKAVLRYFQGNDRLPAREQELLYSYIIEKKQEYQEIYLNYQKAIRSFARNSLIKKRYSKRMALIYHDGLELELLSRMEQFALCKLMFMREITIDNTVPSSQGSGFVTVSWLKQLILSDPFRKGQMQVPIQEGKAVVRVESGQELMACQDASGYVYLMESDPKVERFMEYDDQALTIFQTLAGASQVTDELEGITLYLIGHGTWEKCDKVLQELIFAQYFRLSRITDSERCFAAMKLVELYRQSGRKDLLKALLLRLRLEDYRQEQRNILLEAMVYCEMETELFEALKRYGYRFGASKTFAALLEKRLTSSYGVAPEDKEYVKLCWYLYEDGIRNEVLMNYLQHYFMGPTRLLQILWSDLKKMEHSMNELSIRLLSQMVYARQPVEELFPVFYSWFSKVTEEDGLGAEDDLQLLRDACINRICYGLIANHDSLSLGVAQETWLNEVLQREEKKGAQKHELWNLARLRLFEHKKNLTAEELEEVSFQIYRLVREGRILPFFQEFADRIVLPAKLMHRRYVSMEAPVGSTVLVYYQIGDQQEQVKRLEPVIGGVHVFSFLPFYGENISYYFARIQSGNEIRTEAESILAGDEVCMTRDQYGLLNCMRRAKETKNVEELKALMLRYIRLEYQLQRFNEMMR